MRCPIPLRSPPRRRRHLSVSAAVILIRVAEQIAGPGGTRLAQLLQEMPVGNLPGVSELRGRAYGVGPAQAGCHGSLESERVPPVARLRAAAVLVEWEVGFRDVAVR